MDRQTKSRYEARAKALKALAHPSRLLIVDLLARGEVCVSDLRDEIGADLSTVSRHLSLLRAAGIIRDSKRGNRVFYSLSVPCVVSFFDCVEDALRESKARP